MKEFTAEKTEKVTKLICENLNLSYFSVQKILRKKDIKINGKKIGADQIVNVGDNVKVYYEEVEKQFYDIIYQDDNILLVDKFPYITADDLFIDLSKKYSELYYIHRLDRNTDGLIIFAKNKFAEEELLKGFKNRTFKKYYLALVYGKLDNKEAVLTDYLIKDEKESKVKIYPEQVKNSVKIITKYKVLLEKEGTSLLEVELLTGKTHQIRAHLAHYGHFIIGDGKYGKETINREFKAKRQQLTSYKLQLVFEKESPLYYLNDRVFIKEINKKD